MSGRTRVNATTQTNNNISQTDSVMLFVICNHSLNSANNKMSLYIFVKIKIVLSFRIVSCVSVNGSSALFNILKYFDLKSTDKETSIKHATV